MVSICVCVCRAIPEFSFMDFIKGGCQISMQIAIDFTVRTCIARLHAGAALCMCVLCFAVYTMYVIILLLYRRPTVSRRNHPLSTTTTHTL